jgi:hypothetical protein
MLRIVTTVAIFTRAVRGLTNNKTVLTGCKSVAQLTDSTLRVVGKQNMVMRPAGLGTTNDCVGDSQQQFTRPTVWVIGVMILRDPKLR